MYSKINNIIKESIIYDNNVIFINTILNFIPVTFLNKETKDNIDKLLIGNDSEYKNLSYITSISSRLFIDNDIKTYINNYINMYINTIVSITSNNSNIFIDVNLKDNVKQNENMFYYKVLFYININYSEQVKKYKGK